MHQKSVLFFFIAWFGGWIFCLMIWGNDSTFLFLNGLFSPIPTFWEWITWGGEGGFIGLCSLGIMLWKGWRIGLFVGLGPTFAGLVGQFFKRIVFPNSDRPKLYFEKLHQSIQIPEGVEMNLHHSFPSGHTLGAFCFFYLVAFFVPHRNFPLIGLILAALVGLSRIFLAQHFPQDVVMGSLIGLLFAEIWRRIIPSTWVVNNA